MLRVRPVTRSAIGEAGRQGARRYPPRRLGVRAGFAGVLLALCAGATDLPPWEFIVELPQPAYLKADGMPLRFSEFRGTRVDWGQCMDGDRLFEIEASEMVRSWGFEARIFIPAGREACVQAVVIGLNGDEIGHSYPLRVSTSGPRRNPMAPVRLKLGA